LRAFPAKSTVKPALAWLALAAGLGLGGCVNPYRAEVMTIRAATLPGTRLDNPLADADVAALWPDLVLPGAGPSEGVALAAEPVD